MSGGSTSYSEQIPQNDDRTKLHANMGILSQPNDTYPISRDWDFLDVNNGSCSF